MRPGAVAWMALALVLAAAACNGNLDFGAQRGSGGVSGSGTCGTDNDCGLTVLHCDRAGTRTCVACTADAHCMGPGAPRCDLSLHRCVACVSSADCAPGLSCVAGRCLTACQDDAVPTGCPGSLSCHEGVCGSCEQEHPEACALLPATPFCLAASGTCVGCRTDLDCGGGQPRCDPVGKTCAQCVSGVDCPAAAPLCDPRTGTCVAA